ncbi:MAG: cob(I)yrinic acid a,c-diamide adenosyltransferase [Saccharofermentanales bacterium]|jgi:cob(I)alamin adenosyltransferase
MPSNLDPIRQKLGLIHIYCGDGKGKTTASIGLSVRARGRDLNVRFVQFLKTGTSAELDQLRKLGVDVISGQLQNKFIFQMTEEEKQATKAFFEERLQDVIDDADQYDLIVLDEIMGAIATGIIDEQDVLDFLDTKPEHTEVVLTGRDPSEVLRAKADYVSEVMMRKHPYETSGMQGRAGIEF